MSSTIRNSIRDIPDFPKPGILFKDITPVLSDPTRFREAIDLMCAPHASAPPTKIVGIDARGFIFGAAMADRLRAGFVPLRKAGKLPWETEQASYSLEYGESKIEMHRDALTSEDRILIVDDLLATGGTAAAAVHLVRNSGAQLIGLSVLVELQFLQGRRQIPDCPVWTIVSY